MCPAVTSQVEPCLDHETLAAYLDGLLAVDAIGRADRHIDTCGSCRGELSALAATHSFPTGSGRGEDLEAIALPIEGGTLGRYEILRELGRGSMGVVVRAYDPELRRAVAVKVLEPRLHGAAARELLLREAQAMARLTHPNVVRVYDVTPHGDAALAIAMELVEGPTLRAVIAREMPWREMLAICIAAGRGLAAAHAAKLIHRDYKPENVLCADDGRVVVSDFGLARADDGVAPAASADGLVTTLAGTPAYMAPELPAATPASDQFSFCVATYEALYGERPFAGATLDALRAQIAAGVPRPAPAGTRVPAAIRAVLLRGLAVDPAARYPTMSMLLDALESVARRPRRLALGLAAVALVAVAVVGGLALRGGAAAVSCDVEAAPPWDRAALVTALQARPELAPRITGALDAYWRTWTATRREACEATHARHELSERVLDARTACLERGRREAGEVAALVVGDAARADRAVAAIERVRDPASCTADTSGEPVDPALDRAAAHLAIGEAAEAAAIAESVLAARPDARSRAEALLVRGRAEIVQGAHERAEATLAEALTLAERARADQLVASIWVDMVQTTGTQQHRFETARANMRAAEAAFARSDPGPAVLSRYAYVVGTTLLARGELAPAREQLERALATHGESRPGERGLIHAALCDLQRQLRDYEAARTHCRTAIAMLDAAYGVEHVRSAASYNVWGAIELADNRVEAAREKFQRAMAIYERRGALGERTYALATSNVASTYMRAGDLARARPLYERARDLFAQHHPAHAQRVLPLQGLASVALEAGELQTAIRYYQEAIAQIETVYGKESAQRAVALFNLALTYQRTDDVAKAGALLDEAIAISQLPGKENWSLVASALDLQGTLAEHRKDLAAAVALRERALLALDHADQPRTRAFIETSLGRVLSEGGKPALAVPHYERALAYYDHDGTDPYVVARTQLGLAKALWAVGAARPRALDLAVAAREAFARAQSGQNLEQHRRDVASWLAARGRK